MQTVMRTRICLLMAIAAVTGTSLGSIEKAEAVCVTPDICVDAIDPSIADPLRYITGKADPFQPDVRWGGRAVAVDISAARVMMAATDSGGLFRSERPDFSGATWTHVEGVDAFRMRDVRFAPQSASIVLATAYATSHKANRGGIWRSTDGGRTFARPPQDNPACGARVSAHSIAWAGPNDARVVVATNCGLAYSSDYGASWSFIGPGMSVGSIIPFTSVTARPQPGGDLRIDACGPRDDEQAFWRSFDSGLNWSVDFWAGEYGLRCRDHHTLQALPLTGTQDVRILAYPLFREDLPCKQGEARLAMSIDGGRWSEVPALPPIGSGACKSRPPWVRVQQQPSSGTSPPQYLYVFSNGFHAWASWCTNAPGACSADAPPRIETDHADPNDAAFDPATRCVKLLAADSGVQSRSSPCTAEKFQTVGGGKGGFNALQMYEVTGTVRSDHTDLYFGSQDNDIWNSRNDGTNWDSAICCEGFHLQMVPETVYTDCAPPAVPCTYPLRGRDFVVGTLCGDCRAFVSLQHFGGCGYNPACPGSSFEQPAPGRNYPVLYDYRWFIWADSPEGDLWPNSLYIRDDGGWRKIAEIPSVETPLQHALPIIAPRPGAGFIIYQPIRRYSGNTGLIRIEWAGGTSLGTVRYAEGAGPNSLKSIGHRCEQFVSCDAAIAMDPSNPNHLIAADAGTEQMKITFDGGANWYPDDAITSLVTDGGRLRFRYEAAEDGAQVSQVRTIAFSKADPKIILIGTEAAGVVASIDGGSTWSTIAGSKEVTGATGFFFLRTPRTALVSTWGRGLWRVTVAAAHGPPIGAGGSEASKLERAPELEEAVGRLR